MSEIELSGDQRNQLSDTIERLEGLMSEKAQVNEKIKAEFSEAASAGFDKKAIQQLLKERAADSEKTVSHRRTVSVYRQALAGLAGTPLGDWARQWIANDARYERRAAEPSAMADFMKTRSAKREKDDDRPDAN